MAPSGLHLRELDVEHVFGSAFHEVQPRGAWAPAPELTRVWVLLDSICMRVPGTPRRVVIDGLDMSGQVPGLLSGWRETANGDWLGEVNFSAPYIDGRRHKLSLSHQLVPAYALRPRDGGPDRV